MAFVTGDVVPCSGEEHPFKVVFKQGDAIIAEWLVETKEEGEAEIIEALKGLVDDDEDDDDQEDDDEADDEHDK